MKRRKHKRKVNRILIFTSDAADYKTRQIKVHPILYSAIFVCVCLMIGSLLGVILYGSSFMAKVQSSTEQLRETIVTLTEENATLQSENEQLQSKISILSETINQKVIAEQEQEAKLAEASLPTEFPITGSVTVEELKEPEPICVFSASEGCTVVAVAHGVVQAVEDDVEYGTKVVIDHGNGYESIYRNKGNTKVNVGDEIARGTTIYVISKDNVQVGYQLKLNDAYISPMDMIVING